MNGDSFVSCLNW